jgi:hypothetical protein
MVFFRKPNKIVILAIPTIPPGLDMMRIHFGHFVMLAINRVNTTLGVVPGYLVLLFEITKMKIGIDFFLLLATKNPFIDAIGLLVNSCTIADNFSRTIAEFVLRKFLN